MNDQDFLVVKDLKKYFPIKKALGRTMIVKAVDGVSLILKEGEVISIVGESGCGKSTLGRTILRLYPPTDGKVFFEGRDVFEMSHEEVRRLRSKMQLIFQDPYTSLNPRMTVGRMLSQILKTHGITENRNIEKRIEETLEKVGLEKDHIHRFPHEFSGGQRQRIAIARALILTPKLIVADEPASSLDVSIQAQVLNLMRALRDEFKISYLFITHNLAVARYISNRVTVMYLGKIVEMASKKEFFQNPIHPYSKALISICPLPDPEVKGKVFHLIEGEPPSPVEPPEGCRFHPRCPETETICRKREPELRKAVAEHFVSCHLF